MKKDLKKHHKVNRKLALMKDDSMEPRIRAGYELLFNPERKPKSNSIVIAKINDTILCGRFKIKGGEKFLIPDNSKFSSIKIDENCTLQGVVEQVTYYFE